MNQLDLVLVDTNANVVTQWQRAFQKHTRIHVLQGANLFQLPVRVDAFVLGATAVGDIVAPEIVTNETLIQQAYDRLRGTLGVQTMLHRPCLPIGFAGLLTPFFEPRVSSKPHAIITAVAFTTKTLHQGTNNLFSALLPVFRLILDFNAQCQDYTERITSIACPNLCPDLPVREQTQQIYRAFTMATRRDTLPGHFIQNRFYVPDKLACGPQARLDAHLEFEPFFTGYLSKPVDDPESTDFRHYGRASHVSRHQPSTGHTKTLAQRKEEEIREVQGQAALSRWRHVTGTAGTKDI